MARTQPDLIRGTLDLLILKTLAAAPMHGWALSQRIQQQSENLLRVGQGSLYPALQRLEQQGWIESEWQSTEQNRPDSTPPAHLLDNLHVYDNLICATAGPHPTGVVADTGANLGDRDISFTGNTIQSSPCE